MVTSEDNSIDKRIVAMRKEGAYILTIHTWLKGWDNFSQLDEQVVLCHICDVLNNHNLAVSRNEVRKCFNKYYSKDYHGDKLGYLGWIYKTFQIKDRTRVMTSQVRKKQPVPQTYRGNKRFYPLVLGLKDKSKGKPLLTPESSVKQGVEQ